MKVNQLHDVLEELASKLTKDGRGDEARSIIQFKSLLNGEENNTVAAFAKRLKSRGA